MWELEIQLHEDYGSEIDNVIVLKADTDMNYEIVTPKGETLIYSPVIKEKNIMWVSRTREEFLKEK